MIGFILMWVAYILTAYKIEAVIEPSKSKIVGLVGFLVLIFSFGLYGAAGHIINS